MNTYKYIGRNITISSRSRDNKAFRLYPYNVWFATWNQVKRTVSECIRLAVSRMYVYHLCTFYLRQLSLQEVVSYAICQSLSWVAASCRWLSSTQLHSFGQIEWTNEWINEKIYIARLKPTKPSGLFSCRPHSLELTPEFHPGPYHQFGLFQTAA